MIDLKRIIQTALFLANFANASVMLGGKIFTLDFKGYSGFMFEIGGGTVTSFDSIDLFSGLYSGFGFDASSGIMVGPSKAFVSYGIFGVSIGILSIFEFRTENFPAHVYDFGVMVFPIEKISINFDVITKGSVVTGLGLGVAYHSSRKSKKNTAIRMKDENTYKEQDLF